MMPHEQPINADGVDGKVPARAAGRRRLSTVRLDFFLDPTQRLTEQERALMTAMLRSLIGDIVGEIRGALPAGWAAANDDDSAIVETLTRARLLDDAELMALLFRRADEERIGAAMRARSGRREARADPGAGQSRRRRGFGCGDGADPRARPSPRSLWPIPLGSTTFVPDAQNGWSMRSPLHCEPLSPYPMATPPPMARLVQPRLPLWKIGQKGEVSKHFRTG